LDWLTLATREQILIILEYVEINRIF